MPVTSTLTVPEGPKDGPSGTLKQENRGGKPYKQKHIQIFFGEMKK